MRTHFAFSPRLLAVLLAAGLALPAVADDKADLRDKVLALNNVTGNKPIENKIKDLAADKDAAKLLVASGVTVANEKDKPLNYNALFILASTAHLLKDFDKSELLYKLCIKQAQELQSGTKLKQAYGGIIDLYEQNKKTDELEKVCKEFLDLKGDEDLEEARMVVLATMAQSFATQGRYKDAHKLVDTWLKLKPGNLFLLELKGGIHSAAGEYPEAVAKYLEALDELKKLGDGTNDEQKKEIGRMASALHYRLSGVYVDANQIDKAAEQLEMLLKERPDSPTYNNDLGYIWADHDMKLDEAEKLIRKAIDQDREQRKKIENLPKEFDKDNGAYLDSLGWVLYKKKQYEEAKKWLLLATEDKDNGQHTEIFDHLGDVYLKLGDKAEAVKAWKKGVEFAGKGKRDEQRKADVEKKIKDNQ
jgi:tetratricopeptide (TPR) repeat protein